VEQLVDETVILTLASGTAIEVTPEHPFWAHGKGWIAAAHLAAGDALTNADGAPVPIEAVRAGERGPREVYNFRVEEVHDYYVSPDHVLVKNGRYCSTRIDKKGIVTETWDRSTLKKRFPKKAEYQAVERDIRAKTRNANKMIKTYGYKPWTRVKNPVKTASKEWLRDIWKQKYGSTATMPSSIRVALAKLRPVGGLNQDVDEFISRIQGGLTIREGDAFNQGPAISFVNSTSGSSAGALSRAVTPQRIYGYSAQFIN
jgi:hypothetical protein